MGIPKAIRRFLAVIGRRGGRATAKRLTAKQRRAGARKAALARWAGRKGKPGSKTRKAAGAK